MKYFTLILIFLSSTLFSQGLSIEYVFIENYPLFPNPPVKKAILNVNSNTSVFEIIDTVSENENISSFNEETMALYTWNRTPKSENREYFKTQDSVFSKLNLKKDFFVIKERLPKIKWNFLNERKQILGYNCQAAETYFGGYFYRVYFTTDIPYNFAPWIFTGIPGGILYVENKEKSIVIEAISISQIDGNEFEKRQNDLIKNYNIILRDEYVSRYMDNLDRTRKYARSKGNSKFIQEMKKAGLEVSSSESIPLSSLPNNFDVRGYVEIITKSKKNIFFMI